VGRSGRLREIKSKLEKPSPKKSWKGSKRSKDKKTSQKANGQKVWGVELWGGKKGHVGEFAGGDLQGLGGCIEGFHGGKKKGEPV